MFEVVEIGPLTQRSWFRRRQHFLAKLRAVTPIACEKLDRTFQGYGKYTTQTYRVEFGEGAIISVWFLNNRLLSVGDKLSPEALMGEGYLDPFTRLVGTTE